MDMANLRVDKLLFFVPCRRFCCSEACLEIRKVGITTDDGTTGNVNNFKRQPTHTNTLRFYWIFLFRSELAKFLHVFAFQ